MVRLSALSLFFILLGVILIGFLMNCTWESFTAAKEGFTSDFANSTIVSSELNGKYSVNNVKTAKLTENLFFDPVEKVLIGVTGAVLNMKRKDGTDLSYNTNTTSKIVTDMGVGSVSFTDSSYNIILPSDSATSWASKTIADAKTRFRDHPDNKYLYMDISGSTLFTDAAVLSASTQVRFFYSTGTVPKVVAMDTTSYPSLSTTTEPTTHRYNRTYAPNGMAVSSATTGSGPIAFGWHTPNGIGIVSIPLFVNGLSTNTTFIHVMDITNNNHIGAFYFKGNEVEVYKFSNKTIVGTDKAIPTDTNQGTTTNTEVVFAKDISGLTLPFHVSDSELYADAYHDTAKSLIYLACKVGNDAHQTYVKISGTEKTVSIVKTQTTFGMSSSASTSTSTSTSTSSSDYSSIGNDSFSELTKAVDLVKKMQMLFGSQDSNYLLKTEVVPPVCPTCPSCSSSDGVCTNCGGNGGSGSKSTNNTNIIRSGVGGVTDVGRDAVAGTVELGKGAVAGGLGLGLIGASAVSNVASGASNFVKDSGSGIGQFAKDSASGVFNATKEVGSGAYGATKEIGSSAYGVAKDTVGGTIGLGREIVGGVIGRGNGYENSYGGPQFQNQDPNQGGYLRPQPPQSQGQDPYSYYGSVPPREGRQNYIPRTADFSSFGR